MFAPLYANLEVVPTVPAAVKENMTGATMEMEKFLMLEIAPEDVAAGIGISRRAVYDMIITKRLAARQGGNGRYLIKVVDCHDYIANRMRRKLLDKEVLKAQFDAVVRARIGARPQTTAS